KSTATTTASVVQPPPQPEPVAPKAPRTPPNGNANNRVKAPRTPPHGNAKNRVAGDGSPRAKNSSGIDGELLRAALDDVVSTPAPSPSRKRPRLYNDRFVLS